MADQGNGGYIRLYWKTKDSLAGSNAVSLGLWAFILLSVSVRRSVLSNGTVLQPGELVVSVKRLAERLEVSRKTLDRMLKTFEQTGMITVVKRDRNGTHLSVCNWRTYQAQSMTDGNEKGTQPATVTERKGNEKGTKRERNEPRTKNPKNPESRTPPNPPAISDAEPSPGEGGGTTEAEDAATPRELAAELERRGSKHGADAIAAARRNGCDSALIRAAIAHYDAHPAAWGPGALYERVRTLFPVQDPADLWPPPSPEYESAQRNARRDEARARADRQSAERRAARDRCRQQAAEDEALYGSLVDALKRDAAEATLRRTLGDGGAELILRQWSRGDPATGAVRAALIEAMKAEDAEYERRNAAEREEATV